MKVITVDDVCRLQKKIVRLDGLFKKDEGERLFVCGYTVACRAERKFAEVSYITGGGRVALWAVLDELDSTGERRRKFRRSALPSEVAGLLEEAGKLFNSWTAAPPAEEQAA